jgi:hypothetical protein
MPPTEGEEEENVPIDIKSRIAAFSQGATPIKSRENGPAPPVPRLAKPTLRKTPSTSQLLPAWQQQRQKQDEENTLLKPEHAAASNRPRAYTSDASNGNSPKLGVKSIIALYGQQAQTGAEGTASDSQSRSREVSFDGPGGGLSPGPSASRPSSMETLRRAVPPPTLPPRPKNSIALLSQTNTGSSSHSSSSTGVSSSAAMASPLPSSYAPYLRKGHFTAGTGSSSGAESAVPSLPRRQLGAAQSLEDLTLDPPRASIPSSTMARKLGSGPRWASSSSGNLTMQGESGSSTGSTTMAPAVPPRVSASVTNSPSSSYVPPPPPPKRTVPMQSPSGGRRSTTASSYGTPIPSPSPATASPSSTIDFQSRSAKSSLTTQAWANSSPVIAPPPRHVDIRRMGPQKPHVSTSSASSLRSTKKQQRRRFKTLQAGAVYTREPGEAEQRYGLLFDRLVKEQRAKGAEIRDTSLLNKRTVVRIWKQSQLEDWFLASVWDAATSKEDAEMAKAPFTRAMSAIDFELSRRQAERQGRTVY